MTKELPFGSTLCRSVSAKKQQPVAVSLGTHVVGASLPIPDPESLLNAVGGFAKRSAVKTPVVDDATLREFSDFVRNELKTLDPLEPGTNVSVAYWLENAPYPGWRKTQLSKNWACRGGLLNGPLPRIRRCDLMNKMFGKREYLSGFKEMRLINSRTDMFKVYTGPYFHAIEKKLFSTWKEFIKYVPVTDRAVELLRLYTPGVAIHTTDYTAFESLIGPKLMMACEMQLYEHMLKNVPEGKKVYAIIKKALCGTNECVFKPRQGLIKFRIYGTRMSGDMCTSLGNGFTNLMLMRFVCSKSGFRPDGNVEGDDGVFCLKRKIDTSLFEKLGCVIKIKKTDIESSDFCGNIFSLQSLDIVTDPVEYVVGLGWSTSEMRLGTELQRRQLLRSKAISALYQYPKCPLISEYAKWILRCSKSCHFNLNWLAKNTYERSNLIKALTTPLRYEDVHPATRRLVEREYGLPISKQLEIESWFKRQTCLKPVPAVLFQGLLSRTTLEMGRHCFNN